MRFFEEASDTFKDKKSHIINPAIYTQLLYFQLDTLLDIPAAEMMLLKFLHGLVNKTSQDLPEHFCTFVVIKM